MSTIANTLTDSRASRLKALVRVSNTLKLSEQVALALDTLRKNLLRSALTVLGIVIGITTVIAVSSVINGLNDSVLGGIRELGSDTIIAYRFPWASLSRPPSEWFTRKELQAEWADANKAIDGEVFNPPPPKPVMPDWSQIKSIRKYFPISTWFPVFERNEHDVKSFLWFWCPVP